MAKRNDYQVGKRIKDNTEHANTIRNYWIAHGYNVNVRVCVMTGEIISDTVNGAPRYIDPADLNVPMNVTRENIEAIEQDFLKIYDVTMEQVKARSRDLPPEVAMARNAIWQALSAELGLTHEAIGRRYNRSRIAVTHGIRKAEGE